MNIEVGKWYLNKDGRAVKIIKQSIVDTKIGELVEGWDTQMVSWDERQDPNTIMLGDHDGPSVEHFSFRRDGTCPLCDECDFKLLSEITSEPLKPLCSCQWNRHPLFCKCKG